MGNGGATPSSALQLLKEADMDIQKIDELGAGMYKGEKVTLAERHVPGEGQE